MIFLERNLNLWQILANSKSDSLQNWRIKNVQNVVKRKSIWLVELQVMLSHAEPISSYFNQTDNEKKWN
jgi:hypothetical protein